MRRFVLRFTFLGLIASLFLGVAPKAGAAEITNTGAINSAINSTINSGAFNSTNGLTNTITWTNTTTLWTNYFAASPGTPYFNGINWGSSDTNGLLIGGSYGANQIGWLVGANPFFLDTLRHPTNLLVEF